MQNIPSGAHNTACAQAVVGGWRRCLRAATNLLTTGNEAVEMKHDHVYTAAPSPVFMPKRPKHVQQLLTNNTKLLDQTNWLDYTLLSFVNLSHSSIAYAIYGHTVHSSQINIFHRHIMENIYEQNYYRSPFLIVYILYM